MLGRNQIPDKTLMATVAQRLARVGTGAISVVVRNGEVTISGTLKFEAQRRPAINTASAVAGVKSVIDRMVVKAAAKT